MNHKDRLTQTVFAAAAVIVAVFPCTAVAQYDPMIQYNWMLMNQAIDQANQVVRTYTDNMQKQANESSAKAHCEAAMRAYEQDDYSSCIAEANEAIRLAPNCNGYYTRGVCRLGQKRCEEAEADFRKTLSLLTNAKQAAAAHMNLGNALNCLSRFDKAVDEFREALKAHSGENLIDSMTYEGRSESYLNLSQPDRAIQDLESAIELESRPTGRARLYSILAGIQYTNDRYAEAGESCSHAIAQDPESSKCYLIRGLSRMKKGDRNGAIADWRIASRLGVDYADELLLEYNKKKR